MKLKLMLLTFCLLALSAAEARADDFVITQTGGFLFVVTADVFGPPTLQIPPSFGLAGPGLSVSRIQHFGGGDVGNVQARDICLMTVCRPGMVLATNSTFSGLIGPADVTSATVNGVFYPMVNVTGALTFTSPPVVIPGGVTSQVTVPFTFTAVLTGEARQPGVANPIFTATLSGQGLVTFMFEELGRDPANPRLVISSISYQFQPIPEPATLLLLGTGLAGVAGAARRRRGAARRDS